MSTGDELAAEQQQLDEFYARLDELRREAASALAELERSGTVGTPGARVERDALLKLQRDTLRRLNAVEDRLCIGRLDLLEGTRRYIGRIGLTGTDGTRMLVDWRAPAAQAFYRATPAEPDGAMSRRHLSTRDRRVTGIQDEVLDLAAFAASGRTADSVSADDALMLALNAHRTGHMRDIVATIQAEQDRIIRAPMAGLLVVQGGPGTGKTVVALHRAAFLLYAHRDRLARTGVLVVGPNARFLDYISQVLPSLGETGVVLASAGQLYPGIDARGVDAEDAVAVKGDLRMVRVLAAAVKARQRVPRRPVELNVEGTVIQLTPADVSAARHRAQLSRKPHNLGRERFVSELLPKLAARLAAAQRTELDEENRVQLTNAVRHSPDVRREVNLCWMPLTPERVLRDLYARPELLAAVSPQLTAAERRALARDRQQPWTPADVALLDELAELLGTEAEPVDRQAEADRQAEREYAGRVLELVSEMSPDAAQMTTAATLAERYGPETGRQSLLDSAAADRSWAFGHVVVDEAQELSAMQWRVLMRRCPSKSMTVVGDIAQTGSAAGADSWQQMLKPYLADRWRLAELTVNYRTPAEVMAPASALLGAAGVHSSPVTSARHGEPPVLHPDLDAAGLAGIVASELADGRSVAVIRTDETMTAELAVAEHHEQLSVISPAEAKGLEFDCVVLVEPAAIVAASHRGISDLYVAMTRATQRLHVVYSHPLPAGLAAAAGGEPGRG
ncbi:MAG TPA: ATP-binding domain-containing protein [Jatrophihabitans sp.]|nr:ATP-binding domain-containing protein [Jatrophihabitans sp.]